MSAAHIASLTRKGRESEKPQDNYILIFISSLTMCYLPAVGFEPLAVSPFPQKRGWNRGEQFNNKFTWVTPQLLAVGAVSF